MRVWRKDESQEQKFDGEDVFLTITCAYTASKARKAWGKFDCLSKLEKIESKDYFDREELGLVGTICANSGNANELIEYLQDNTNLNNSTCLRLIDSLASAAKKTGKITKEDFLIEFMSLVGSKKKEGRYMLRKIAGKIFDSFDKNEDGFVDNGEFLAGMTIIMGGSSEQRLRSTFRLFDSNGDGFITFEEMVQYFSSFFEACFNLDHNFHNRFTKPDGKRYTAKDVAESTALNCFAFADKNEDGKVSFDEFKCWFSSPASFICEMPSPHYGVIKKRTKRNKEGKVIFRKAKPEMRKSKSV
ncbi:hypothetical protein AAMO2058_000670300 [Amorphochlora amoebiformis]